MWSCYFWQTLLSLDWIICIIFSRTLSICAQGFDLKLSALSFPRGKHNPMSFSWCPLIFVQVVTWYFFWWTWGLEGVLSCCSEWILISALSWHCQARAGRENLEEWWLKGGRPAACAEDTHSLGRPAKTPVGFTSMLVCVANCCPSAHGTHVCSAASQSLHSIQTIQIVF